MKVSLIAARSDNNVISRKGKIPWNIPSDLAYFKNITLEHYVIMGRKTFDSLEKKPLPNRINIVISQNVKYEAHADVVLVHDFKEALKVPRDNGAKEVFIIGGAQIYSMALPQANKIYLTEVHCHVDGDTFFPDFDEDEWKETKYETHPKDRINEYDYSFRILERK